MLWVDRNASHRTHLHTLRLIKVTYAFCALGRVDFVDFRAEVDRLIGAFRFADIAIDAFIGDHQGHKNLTISARIIGQRRRLLAQRLKYPCGTLTQRRFTLPLRGL
jgi:hypothetical protein